MSDLRLITLLPAQNVSGVQQPDVSHGATSQAASAISKLPAGTILSGFIVNRDASGNPILRTATGDIAFASNFFLKIGSEVVIRVENQAAGTLAHILTVDGQPPEVAETLSGFAQEPDVILGQHLTQSAAPQALITTPSSTAQAAPPPPAPQIAITGTLISSPPAAGVQAPLPAGTQLSLTITTLSVPTQPAPATPAPANAPAPALSAAGNTASYGVYARAAGTPLPTPAAQPQTPPQPALPAAVTGAAAAATPAAQPLTIAAAPAPPSPAITANVIATPAQKSAATPAAIAGSASPAPAAPPAAPEPAAAIPATVAGNEPPQTMPVAVPLIPSATNTAETANAPPAAPSAIALQPAAAAPAQAGQTIAAVVIGNEPTGEAVVQTQAGVIRLQPGTTLPVGSAITLEITQVTPPPAQQIATAAVPLALGQAAAPAAPLTALAQEWTSLQQIVGLLADSNALPETAAASGALPWIAVAGAAAPSPAIATQDISTGLLLFMSALKGNDFRNWLGKDAVQWLQDNGHGELVAKASGEFALLARQYADALPQHWQPVFFPVAVGGELHQVRLFVKRDRQRQSGQARPEKQGDDTRFVVEVDLSQLGGLQMDGFVRRQPENVQFDLVIRSLAPLPAAMRQDLLQIYNEAGELTGYKGSLAFQTVREFPVSPMEDIVAHGMNAVTA